MGNAPYSTCGTTLARHLQSEESRAEIQTHDSYRVFLNVYDLNEDWLQANSVFRALKIGGAFHTGVEVHGQEWSYGQEGVSSTQPRAHEVHVYRQSIEMGTTNRDRMQVLQLIQALTPRWQGSDYDILRRNCCSFADFLCGRLVRKSIPPWVHRFPKVAGAASRGLGKVMDFGGSVSTSASNDRIVSGSASYDRHFGRSISALSVQSQASVTTVASPASTSPSSSECGSPCTTPRGWSRAMELDDEEDQRPFRWR